MRKPNRLRPNNLVSCSAVDKRINEMFIHYLVVQNYPNEGSNSVQTQFVRSADYTSPQLPMTVGYSSNGDGVYWGMAPDHMTVQDSL